MERKINRFLLRSCSSCKVFKLARRHPKGVLFGNLDWGFPICFLFTYTMDTMEMEVDLCLASKRPLEPAETDWRLLKPKWRLPSGGRLHPERVSRATWWLQMDPGPAQDFWPREVKRRQGHLPQRGHGSEGSGSQVLVHLLRGSRRRFLNP